MKLTETQKEQRRYIRQEKKYLDGIQAEKMQRPVRSLTISIEWRKSRVWGSNPHASVEVFYVGPDEKYSSGGIFENVSGFTAGGCGYDKESTVIAEIFNRFLKYKLYGKIRKINKSYHDGRMEKTFPYGIDIRKYPPSENLNGEKIGARVYRSFGGGIGTNCYYDIAKAIHGKFEHIASGKTFDAYKYTDGAKK